MPSITRLHQAYSSVNLTGHIQDNKLGAQAHINQAIARGLQGRNLHGFAALRNRASLNLHFLLAACSTSDRMMAPLTAL